MALFDPTCSSLGLMRAVGVDQNSKDGVALQVLDGTMLLFLLSLRALTVNHFGLKFNYLEGQNV